ncbi:MAG: cell shape-determining protein MreC [Candidatus Paceibacteria bacterium]|jgi:cell shape-determining protein MreC
MIYLQRNKKKSRKKVVIISILGILIFLTLFKINFIQDVAYRMFSPVFSLGNVVTKPFSGVATLFKSKSKLVEDMKTLEDKIKDLKIELMSVDSLQKENDDLRNITKGIDEGVVAKVITRPPNSPYDTFIIDLGYEDGMSVTNHIYTHGIRVGEIVQVHKKSSVVRLYSSSGNQIPIRIDGNIEAQADGQGGGRFITIIPKDIEVKEGDSISLPDETKAFSLISKIETTEANSFQGIFFNLPFNISEISFVEVVEK